LLVAQVPYGKPAKKATVVSKVPGYFGSTKALPEIVNAISASPGVEFGYQIQTDFQLKTANTEAARAEVRRLEKLKTEFNWEATLAIS